MVKKLSRLLSLNKLLFGQSFFLGLILVIFLLTRLIFLGNVPSSAYWDEASIGYNAFTISENLKDEWGDFLPLHFRAFGEFKLPVYVYSVAPFVKILGLNEFAVRLPAVLYSFGAIFLTYLLVSRLTKNKWISLLAPLYLSISPWFFIFSLTGYEAVAGVFFTLLGIFFYANYKKTNYFLLLSALSYILAAYSYNSMRVIVPVLLVIQLAFLLKEKETWKYLLASILLFAVAFVPILRLTVGEGGMRFAMVGERDLATILLNYLSHFSPQFLLSGDINPRSTMPGYGIIWILDLIIVPLGLIALAKKKTVSAIIFLITFFLSLVPSAITKEAPHALRSLMVAPMIALLWVVGIEHAITTYKNYSKYIIGAVSIITFFGYGMFLQEFSRNYNQKYSEHWQYGYKKVFTDYGNEFGKYNKVIISHKYGQPYIFQLFYNKVSGEEFRQSVRYNAPDMWGISLVAGYSNLEFREPLETDMESNNLVFSSTEIANRTFLDKIDFLDGTPALYVYK